MSSTPAPLFAPRRVLAALAALAVAGVAAILLVGRGRAATEPAIAGMIAAAVLCGVLAVTFREQPGRVRGVLQVALLVLMSATTAPISWLFGPNSAFSALLALVLVVAGLVTGGSRAEGSAVGGWLVYATIAAGQAIVTTLVLSGELPDASLLAVAPPAHPLWHHAAAHVALQLVYLVAFVAGRAFQLRYRRLSDDLDGVIAIAARHEALLDEARAEYQRALAVGRRGIFSNHEIGGYQLGELIGRGGTGEVYDARDLRTGGTVAVKLMRGDRLRDPAEVARFLAEAGTALRVQSPHVVQAHEAGGVDADIPFLAMEKLAGNDLARVIATRGRLDREALRRLVEDISAALEAVHAEDLVHGDVNPRNLVSAGDRWKLIDFGATHTHDHAAQLGTPRFIAPELVAGGRASAVADLYGFAACLYTAITGEEPFSEIPPRGLAHATATREPIDPRLRAEISDDLARALQIGLAKAPADRYADAAALRIAFAGALDGALAPELAARASALPPWSVAPPAVDWEPTDAVRESAPAIPLRPIVEPPSSVDATRTAAWQLAFRDKVQRERFGVLALCIGGAIFLGAIVREPLALWIAWVCIGGIGATLAIQRSMATWPWVIVGALSVGPALAFGLHSGFASVIAFLLFAGGLFRASSARPWWNNEWAILGAVLGTHTLAFAAIASGLLDDLGNTPTSYASAPAGTPVFLHAAVLAIYVAAFTSARAIDRRYGDVVRRSEVASRDAAAKEALLATARSELDRALAGETGGLFTGSTIGAITVERLLGRGGMGEVYVARRGAERIALKVIRADRIADPDSLRRFAREATTLQRIDSPYVARVLDIGTGERVPYLAMELVEGTSLTELLRERGGRLDPDRVRAMIRDVARGLEDVHRAGVLHRDVKPSNLVLTRGDAGRWKLVDFGIAKLVDAPSDTTGNIVIGTPAYMAPETIEGHAADPRSDLFSLCAVAYRAVVGQPAWTVETALARVRGRPADPARDAAVPRDLGLALRIGLATSPADRFASGADLAAAFDAAFEGRLDEALRRRAHALLVREPWG